MRTPALPGEASGTTAVREPAVILEGVVRRFGPTVAVDRVDLRIEAGSAFGLIGPNGAGKTTTFGLVCGWLAPTAGRVRVLGHAAGDVARLRGRVGALPQDAVLPANDPVVDVLTFWARLQGRARAQAATDAREALEQVGLGDWGRVRCGALSHGLAKRVALAQAFLGGPELVLLDEPTAGLDPKSAYHVRERLKAERRAGRTLIVSSHNLQELEELCDAAAILDQGRLVACGPMAELTRAVEEVRFALSSEPVPLAEVQALPKVKRASWDPARRTLTVAFSREESGPEEMIAAVLRLLLERGVGIAGVAKGRPLEDRILELT